MPFLVSFSFVRSVDFDADRVRCSRIAEVVFGNDRDGSAVIGASESRVLDQLIELANRQPVYVVRESLSLDPPIGFLMSREMCCVCSGWRWAWVSRRSLVSACFTGFRVGAGSGRWLGVRLSVVV